MPSITVVEGDKVVTFHGDTTEEVLRLYHARHRDFVPLVKPMTDDEQAELRRQMEEYAPKLDRIIHANTPHQLSADAAARIARITQEEIAESEKRTLLEVYKGDEGRRMLFKIPDDERTPGHVLAQRQHAAVGGCCERFANHSGCDCLEEAYNRAGRK